METSESHTTKDWTRVTVQSMTDQIMKTIDSGTVEHALRMGRRAFLTGRGSDAHAALTSARVRMANYRSLHGFAAQWTTILTEPGGNLKLDKAATPSYGITLQHYVVKSAVDGKTRNLCPNAGDCTKVCVLDNGAGRYDTVQRARRWKTDFLAHDPFAFFVHLGWELARAIYKHGKGHGGVVILLRPNVNSDLEWEKIAPSLFDGSIFDAAIMSYGYTKLETVLATDGWLAPYYRVAYSWNERTIDDGLQPLVSAFLKRGGSVAQVTDRKRYQPVHEPRSFKVVDADLTDEWIFQMNTIGDLSAKGSARNLIGKSGFVVQRYGNPAPRKRVSNMETSVAVKPGRVLASV